MVLYPDAQRKAQEELDKVLGGSRLPTFEDEPSLPYVQALVNEVFRWHPVTPLGPLPVLHTYTPFTLHTAIVHRVTIDDVYEGLSIPKGSTVIGNVWAILHDPEMFPEPEVFRPEHFLPYEEGGTLPPGAPPFPDFAFGFGRRVCPGRHLARASVWIACANVLAAFNISPALDEHGRPLPVKEQYTSGIVS
jgi:cytochrome P450